MLSLVTPWDTPFSIPLCFQLPHCIFGHGYAQSLPSLPCSKHDNAALLLFLLHSSFEVSMPTVETSTIGAQMNIAQSTLEPSAALAYFASALGIYKHRRVHNVP